MNQDLQHLRVLSIFHYVVGGFAALVACIPFIHFFIGLAIVLGSIDKGNPPPAAIGVFLMVFAALFILAGWIYAFFLVLAGRALAAQRNYTFCLVMGGVACLFMPFGTVLGVFTIVVLMRESVHQLFEGAGAATA